MSTTPNSVDRNKRLVHAIATGSHISDEEAEIALRDYVTARIDMTQRIHFYVSDSAAVNNAGGPLKVVRRGVTHEVRKQSRHDH